jgi:carbon storage regulator
MLVLSRRTGERVMIGKNIAVVVLQVGGNRVKLGVDAPPEIAIQREELDCKIGTKVAIVESRDRCLCAPMKGG